MGAARLVMSYEAFGATPLAVLRDAHRIAHEAIGESAEVRVEVGTVEPNLTSIDGVGHTSITRWRAECFATADVEVPDA